MRAYIRRRSSRDDRVGTSVHVELVSARQGKNLIVCMTDDEQRAHCHQGTVTRIAISRVLFDSAVSTTVPSASPFAIR